MGSHLQPKERSPAPSMNDAAPALNPDLIMRWAIFRDIVSVSLFERRYYQRPNIRSNFLRVSFKKAVNRACPNILAPRNIGAFRLSFCWGWRGFAPRVDLHAFCASFHQLLSSSQTKPH